MRPLYPGPFYVSMVTALLVNVKRASLDSLADLEFPRGGANPKVVSPYYYQPHTKYEEGVMFSKVFVCSRRGVPSGGLYGGGHCLEGELHGGGLYGGKVTPQLSQTPKDKTHPFSVRQTHSRKADLPPPTSQLRKLRIRSTSGQHASNWNAFLFYMTFT